ncbi:hypothetical protein [Afifella sp. IM 167]|uniref:hypothetical protein n=1 Tax=Afifella sp. IM 167 TaxID=2033586 RepID=UPI001CC9BCA2|nr:hypothetical protein [Afifella sp. IM 167]MBZ8133258.1 hypothetical protein [Afifella sp. IM 167]
MTGAEKAALAAELLDRPPGYFTATQAEMEAEGWSVAERLALKQRVAGVPGSERPGWPLGRAFLALAEAAAFEQEFSHLVGHAYGSVRALLMEHARGAAGISVRAAFSPSPLAASRQRTSPSPESRKTGEVSERER